MNSLRAANDTIDSKVSGVIRRFHVERGAGRMIVMVIVAFAFFSIMRPDVFLSLNNLQNIGLATPEIGILALAMTVTMLTGGIDLSLVGIVDGAAIAMSGVYSAMHSAMGSSADSLWPVLILVALAVGLVGGLINGFLIAYVGITPILATLATFQIFNGIDIVVTGGKVLYAFPSALGNTGQVAIGPTPLLFIVFIVIAIVVGIIISKTGLGRRIALEGANPVASKYSAIDSRRTLVWTYVLAGLLAGAAGAVIVMRNPTASADYGSSYTLLVIVIAVLGGTNPSGGFTTMLGVTLAAITLEIVSTGFTTIKLSQYEYSVAQGVILILIMIFDQVNVKRLFSRKKRAVAITED